MTRGTKLVLAVGSVLKIYELAKESGIIPPNSIFINKEPNLHGYDTDVPVYLIHDNLDSALRRAVVLRFDNVNNIQFYQERGQGTLPGLPGGPSRKDASVGVQSVDLSADAPRPDPPKNE